MIELSADNSLPGRELHDHPGDHKTLVIRRALTAPVERVWSALTDPKQVSRWYLPLEGDLREGGYYVLVGNAVGEIRRCDPLRELALSWVYGEFESKLGLRFGPHQSGTMLELVHGPIPIDMIANPTPELWGLAVNWEMLLSGLDDFLAGKTPSGLAIEWMPRLSHEERSASMALANALNDAWVALIGASPREC
jgi:uncharacterized protein YndB with AHSA1/START domain